MSFVAKLVATACLALVAGSCVEPGPECLAPANPGGGWDLTCRAVAQVLDGTSMRVRNVPGAGGGIAFAHVVAEREGDPNLIVAASPATTLRLAQGQFGAFEAKDVRWLAAVAADYGVIVVRGDAPWRSFEELLDAWRLAPSEIVAAGGSAVGGQDHMKLLVLAREAGIDPKAIRYVPFDGGGEAVTALLGGFVSVVPLDVSEVLSLFEASEVRVLAALSPERLDALHGVPTARELGYDVSWVVWRGFYAPAGIDDARYDHWLDVLESVAASPEWEKLRARTGLSEFFLAGEAFENFVDEQVASFEVLTAELGLVP